MLTKRFASSKTVSMYKGWAEGWIFFTLSSHLSWNSL